MRQDCSENLLKKLIGLDLLSLPALQLRPRGALHCPSPARDVMYFVQGRCALSWERMRFAGETRSAVLSRSSRAQENALPHAAYRCEECADSQRGISTASPQEQSATLPQGESLTAPQEESALSVASAAQDTPIRLKNGYHLIFRLNFPPNFRLNYLRVLGIGYRV